MSDDDFSFFTEAFANYAPKDCVLKIIDLLLEEDTVLNDEYVEAEHTLEYERMLDEQEYRYRAAKEEELLRSMK